jgi:hydrogenase maturation protease
VSAEATPANERAPILLLGLGNDIMGDDAVALHTCELLRRENHPSVDIIASPVAGLALLDYLEGREKAIILDSIVTGNAPPGTIHSLTPGSFQNSSACSPHFLGLQETVSLAERLDLRMPSDLRIIAMEIEPSNEIREGLSGPIQDELPHYLEAVREILRSWLPSETLAVAATL